MKNDIIEEDIQLEKPLDLVRFLNHGLTTKEDISEEDYLAMAGYGADDITNKINRALRRKFGSDAPVVHSKYNKADVIFAYAFLMKELLFEHAFEDFKDPITFYGHTNEAQVEAFGIFKCSGQRHRKLRDQVEIIDYMNHHDFIIRLKSKHPDDEIILANVEPGRTLLATFEKVNWRIAKCRRYAKPESIGENDILQIPKFDLSIDHSYEPLLDLYLVNKGFEDYFVAEARQDIRFRLDECGATSKSEAIFALKKGPPVDFRALNFQQSVYAVSQEKGWSIPLSCLVGGECRFDGWK